MDGGRGLRYVDDGLAGQHVQREDDRGEHVVIVVDVCADSWSILGDKSGDDVAPNRRADVMLAVNSAHLLDSAIRLYHADNRTTIIAATAPSPKRVDAVEDLANEATNNPISIVKALGVALCAINRSVKEHSDSNTATRIILITATPIPAYDFVNCMNCAFAAQKLGIVIDILDCSQSTTPELLQVGHHTNGWFVSLSPKDSQQGALAHSLLYYFVASAAARKYLTPPSHPATDMRTICFCHQKLISIGYVCSVCLFVFCEKKRECGACKSRELVTIKRKT